MRAYQSHQSEDDILFFTGAISELSPTEPSTRLLLPAPLVIRIRTMMYRMSLLVLWSMASGVHGQNFTSNGCLYTMAQLILLEEEVTDFSTTRQYTICENRVLQIGSLDMNNDLVSGSGEPFFPVRPNMHIRCGETGARENGCLVVGGDVQVDGTNYFGIGTDLDLTNVVFEGFTFAAATRYSVWATKKGDITFIDCEWKVRSEVAI
jgi:hypothetical protein